MARTAVGSPDDWGKWLAVAGALVAVGVLPRKYKAPVGALATLVAIWGFLE